MERVTQQPDRGAVRSAVEGLLRTCVDLQRQADGAASAAQARVNTVLNALTSVHVPRDVLDVPALTTNVDGVGRRMDADLRERLAELQRPMVTEIHTLLGLLAPLHGLAALPPLVAAAPSAALRDYFPAGFAQNYVKDLLSTVDTSTALAVNAAGSVPVRSDEDSAAAKQLVADAMPEDLRDEALRMLQDSNCHAVERHGPHIARETQLARLLWLKDPSGQEHWGLLPDGGAESDHWCGPASGGFSSATAMAKPLETLLRWARDHAGSVNELLTKNTRRRTHRISIHISAAAAGLVAGDAAAYRGTGTSDRAMTADWLDARRYAMLHGEPPVFAVPYDPIAEGPGAGVFLQFKRIDASTWELVTCYPVGDRNSNSKRLEDLT